MMDLKDVETMMQYLLIIGVLKVDEGMPKTPYLDKKRELEKLRKEFDNNIN